MGMICQFKSVVHCVRKYNPSQASAGVGTVRRDAPELMGIAIRLAISRGFAVPTDNNTLG